jgi:hypothetical protein
MKPSIKIRPSQLERDVRNEPPPAIAPIGGVAARVFEPLLPVLPAPMDVTVDVMPSLVITDVNVLPIFGVGKADPKGVVLIIPNPAVSVASLLYRSLRFRTTVPHHHIKLLTTEVEKTEAADGKLDSGITSISSTLRLEKATYAAD